LINYDLLEVGWCSTALLVQIGNVMPRQVILVYVVWQQRRQQTIIQEI